MPVNGQPNSDDRLVGLRDLRRRLSEVIFRVRRGERFAITDHGRVIAWVEPAGQLRRPARLSRHQETSRDSSTE
jgi:prevent-host-death family protein